MGIRIATNIQSLAAQRNLSKNANAQRLSIEKLSSGSRINRAADDAAGLAIGEKMRAQIRSINQGIRNAQDGISIIQTSEGGMSEISNILVRFRELSMQAASDTVSDTERSFINKEVQQLRGEVSRISDATEFNGIKLLNGQGGLLDIQIGAHNDPETDRFTIHQRDTDVRPATLGLEGVSVATKDQARGNLDRIDSAINLVNERRAGLGAIQNRIQSAINSGTIYVENLATAKSRIWDTDMAAETAEMTKADILYTAGLSVLTQANQTPQQALKLLT